MPTALLAWKWPVARLRVDRDGCFRGAHRAIVAGTLFICASGYVLAFPLILLTLLVPTFRSGIDSAYRVGLQNRFLKYGQELRAYGLGENRIPWAATLLLIVVPVGFLNLTLKKTMVSGDTWPTVATANSMVVRGNSDISAAAAVAPPSYFPPDAHFPYCVMRTATGCCSTYPAGMSLFATPSCLLARIMGNDVLDSRIHDHVERWTAAWVGAACLGLFFLIAVRLADARSAAIAVGFLATGSAMFTIVGQALWQHGGVIFWALLAFFLEFQTRGRRAELVGLCQGIALGTMLSCRLSAAIILVVLGTWILLRSPRRGIAVGVGTALGCLPWAILYQSVYDTPLGPSQMQMATGNWGWSVESFWAVLFSPAAGLFVYQPWILLAAFLPLIGRQEDRDGTPRGWMTVCLILIVLQVTLIARWKIWWGGDCWGSRLVADIVPFAALLCLQPIRYLCERRWGIWMLVGWGFISIYLHFSVAYVKISYARTIPMLTDWSHAPFLPWSSNWK